MSKTPEVGKPPAEHPVWCAGTLVDENLKYMEGGREVVPVCSLVFTMISGTRPYILGHELGKPGSERTSLATCLADLIEKNGRPAHVLVPDERHRKYIEKLAAKSGFKVVVDPSVAAIIAKIAEEMRGYFSETVEPPPLETLTPVPGRKGITAEHQITFFQAAGAFWEVAPWREVPDFWPVRVTGPGVPMIVMSVMGNAGEEFGLMTFKSLAAYKQLVAGSAFPERAEVPPLLSITFAAAKDLPHLHTFIVQSGIKWRHPMIPTIMKLKSRGNFLEPTLKDFELVTLLLTLMAVVGRGPGGKTRWSPLPGDRYATRRNMNPDEEFSVEILDPV